MPGGWPLIEMPCIGFLGMLKSAFQTCASSKTRWVQIFAWFFSTRACVFFEKGSFQRLTCNDFLPRFSIYPRSNLPIPRIQSWHIWRCSNSWDSRDVKISSWWGMRNPHPLWRVNPRYVCIHPSPVRESRLDNEGWAVDNFFPKNSTPLPDRIGCFGFQSHPKRIEMYYIM